MAAKLTACGGHREILRVLEYWFSVSAAFQQHLCLHPIPRGDDWIAVGCGPDTGILKAPGILKCSQMTATVLEGENNIARGRDEKDYFENCDDSRCKNAPASLDPENPAGSLYKSSDERRWSQQVGVISRHNSWGAGRCFRAVPPYGSDSYPLYTLEPLGNFENINAPSQRFWLHWSGQWYLLIF